MEDMTFHELDTQVHETKKALYDNEAGGWPISAAEKLILKNQLVIMKALDHIDNDIQSIPR